MRRVVAHILVCVMFLTTLQNVSILKAAESSPLGFALTREILKEDSTGLSVGERDDASNESALVKFEAGTATNYKLEYYIEAVERNQTVTKKVSLDFNNIDKTNVDLGVTVSTDGKADNDKISYVERIFNNANFTWGYSGTSNLDVEKAEKRLVLGTGRDRNDQEFNIELTSVRMTLDGNTQDNLKIRVKVIGEDVYVYTNGIAKGNITPFNLYYDGSIAPIASAEMFNGPKSYTITPTHLYVEGGQLKSLEIIEDITKIKPGSVPGVKVQFAQVKKVSSNKFEYVDKITGQDNSKITLQIGTRYTIGDMSNAIRLDFKPENGADVKINLKDTISNVVKVDNNTVSMYLSQTKVEGADVSTIKWDVLETSTIVDGSLQYGNQAEKYWPTNKGYTYLGYTLHKTSSNQVQINIQPYNIKSRATYSIYILNDKDTERGTPSVVYEYDPNKTETTSITAIVPAQSPSYFQVVVNIDANTFVSQMVFYDPDEFPTVPETTQIKTIDNVYVVPNENTQIEGAQPQAIGFDIAWTAPKNVAKLLKEGKLYYELLLRKDPKDYDPITNTGNSTEDIYGTYSKIFEVSLDDKGQVIVKTVAGTAGSEEKNKTPELRYSEVNETFTMEEVSLMNFGAPNNQWEKLEIKENHLSTASGGYLANVEGTAKDSLGNRVVPGTYYLSFRTVLVSNDDAIPVVYSEESNMVAVSLDNTTEIVPVPGTITGEDTSNEDKTVISEKVTIKNVDIRSYVKRMLEPAHLYLYKDAEKTTGRYSGEYEIYLYQKSAQLASTIAGVEKGTITPIKLNKDSNKINLDGSEGYIDKLRSGGVIPITLSADDLTGQGSEDFEILGLDPNEVYYVQVRMKLNPWRNDPSEAGTKDFPSRYSLFSKEFTFTTTTTPLPPSEDDKVPPTPEKIWVVEQPNNTTVTLGWAPADFEEDEDVSKTYYEFIRTELGLADDEKSKTIEDLVAADDKRVGFRSDSPTTSNPLMSTYTSKNPTWTNLTPEQVASKFQLTDNTLNPNTVYYYYVRTVCMIDGKPVKSTWIMVPVTTAPVLPPINLKVELPKNYSYDVTDETVISFDAPVPSDSSVPTDYAFDIAVQGEMDSEYSTTKYSVTKLTPNTGSDTLTPEGYTHFVYKITGLKPNKRYYIKVRVIDKTKPLVDGNTYPTSLYCDKVTTRTEYDEDEAEKDNKYEEYLKKFDAEAEKLRRKPYWEVEEDYSYKYRESYIKTELGLQSEYELVVGDNAKDAYYYMPASLFTNENAANTTLKITLGEYTANIRPYTLTEDNEQIQDAIDAVAEDKIEDYYVGIRFKLSNTSIRINGESAVSPQMTIDMELVYIRDKDRDIEENIMSALNELIESERKTVISQLERKIYNGKIADDVLAEIIEEAMEDIQEDHMEKVERILNRTTKKEISINEIQKSILLVARLDSYALNAYYLITNWTPVDSYAVGNGFGIEASKLGTYILTGQASLVTTIPSLAPYQSFIAKYNLTDFFTLDSYTIKTAASKEQVYGALARVIGASRGTDYVVYLKNNGVKGVNSIGMTNAIRQDEAIYLIMQGYEKVHKRSVSSIAIKNRQSVQNIGAFQTPYHPYVYAAVELKIVSNPNSKVVPSKQMSIEEIIAMLYKAQV